MATKNGFTLIELLVTLSILLLLLTIPLVLFPSMTNNAFHSDVIARQIKDDLLFAQQTAMSQGRQTYVRFNQNTYRVQYSVSEVILQRESIPHLSARSSSLPLQSISFQPSGHPTHSGQFFVTIGEQTYRYTIYLGKGMISYAKQ
ncbi:competence type IV pilus minor pilin ComGD [Halalkalibacter sp. APA_J-10(15)]|uniref:competence type IV pilus minor pilin ComGD n=1 Tax=unclassified Halalkalibacter TaxID=2893063 RepID=UPI001FF1E205|nr:competence type IV pilus minor pilin ComGD [Halalkalibacter sp. APA_J-10(15)]